MILDETVWKRFFKGFDIYDCTYGYEHGRVGFSLIEVVDEEHAEYDNPFYTPEKRIIYIAINNVLEKRVYGGRSTGMSLSTISSGWSPSQAEFVMASTDSAILSYREDEYKGVENRINTLIPGSSDMTAAITKVIRVGTSIYAIGSAFRVYKRIAHQVWEEWSKTLPVPDGYIEEKAETISRSLFKDLSGFSESDMYAVGGMGTVYHFDGKKWQQITFPTNKLLYTVCCGGDGFVYIADFDGAIWKGRDEKWEKIINGAMSMPFLDMGWFDGRLWCASDYGIWVLEDEKLVLAMYAKYKPIPPEVAVLSKRIDVSPDGTVMMVCGSRGAAIYNGNEWNILFDSVEFE
ncbi:hypothetical protein RQL50_14975 [Citrobacter freundii]|uniref:WD40/YVTN/BNR-like repeat-containing protein n=1 Tax=Citrobacter freundii TaxID=546 RepID=UPI0028BEFAF7|nr:hypothetical protein [Citrobacter freundii]MDT7422416.1 hypothetical protein [Citrobacter freundii]